jgi:hypothetical protein
MGLFVLDVCLFFSYGREYADPYLGHSIGPVAGYGVSICTCILTLSVAQTM